MKSITMKDIAQKAGVSHQAVSQILNNKETLVSDKTRDRILKISRDLNYQPNFFAQSLRSGRTNQIGITTIGQSLGYFDYHYSMLIYRGLGEFFVEHNYKLVFQHVKDVNNTENYLELAKSKAVDGIIHLFLFPEIFKNQVLPQLQAMEIPFVAIHSFTEDMGCHAVGLDIIKGAQLAIEHLIGHGYSKIGFVKWSVPGDHVKDLHKELIAVLERHGLSLAENHIYVPGGYSAKNGYRLAERLLKEKDLPRALFVSTEDLAYGMIKKFREAGISVPDDIAIIGFGNTSEHGMFLSDLTTIQQPAWDKGYKAGELLFEIINENGISSDASTMGKGEGRRTTRPKMIVLEPELIIGKSCGCK